MFPLQETWFPLGCMFFLDELPRNYLLLWRTSVTVHISELHTHPFLVVTYMKSLQTSLFRARVRKKKEKEIFSIL